MKIVVKHVDILRGEMKEIVVNEYLVYLYDSNEQAIEAHVCYGEKNLDVIVNNILYGKNTENLILGKGETSIPIRLVSYNEFKELNEIEDGE